MKLEIQDWVENGILSPAIAVMCNFGRRKCGPSKDRRELESYVTLRTVTKIGEVDRYNV